MGQIGTFARVWLVRLKNPTEEDRDNVYALKVLRKVEGPPTLHCEG
jgi:protein kinase A